MKSRKGKLKRAKMWLETEEIGREEDKMSYRKRDMVGKTIYCKLFSFLTSIIYFNNNLTVVDIPISKIRKSIPLKIK